MDSAVWLSALALVAAVALTAEGVRRLRRRWVLVKVEGPSMEPTLRDGAEVLAKRTRRVAVGDIVVVAAPDPDLGWAEARVLRAPWWVKRIAAGPGDPLPPRSAPLEAIADELAPLEPTPPAPASGAGATVPPGHYFLLGDNPAGADSRRHGPCPAGLVLGVVIREF